MDPEAPRPLILEVRDLKKHYPVTRGFLRKEVGCIRAVDGVDFSIHRGETLGLVGESGCGKSTLGRLILRLEEPSGGEVFFQGRNVFALPADQVRALRRQMQIIFQDPYSSLNPRQTVGRIIAEGLVIHGMGSPKERRERVRALMEVVGLRPELLTRYPHEFSGGQRQRIGIARALAVQPALVICDEPLSALDVSIQAQVINLLLDLQERFGLTYLFISHDLSVVRHLSDRVAVMVHGVIVELAPTEDLFQNPLHPYTQALLEAIPVPDPDAVSRGRTLRTEAPPVPKDAAGCPFSGPCRLQEERCRADRPELREQTPDHWVRCFISREAKRG